MAVPTRDRDISAHPPATAHHGSAAVPEPGHVLGRLVAPHGPRPVPPVPPPCRARHPRVAGWQPVGAASGAAAAPCHPRLSPREGKPSGGRPWPSHERRHQPPASRSPGAPARCSRSPCVWQRKTELSKVSHKCQCFETSNNLEILWMRGSYPQKNLFYKKDK